jgi:N6-L-threonylcarbamoyladenine synthase
VIAGGVSANKLLRNKLAVLMKEHNGSVCFPRPEFCTDNGAMVAYAGYRRLAAGQHEPLSFNGTPRWPLDSLSSVEAIP